VKTILLPGDTPLISLRLAFRTGAAFDPPGKEGLAALTAGLMAGGGTRRRSYKQILDALFPMAVAIAVSVDKEVVCFEAECHSDHIGPVYEIFREMLLEPGWREEDFDRVREDHINSIRVVLRGQNDEELAKEALYCEIYKSQVYGWHNAGTVSALAGLTIEDLKRFHQAQFTSGNATLGLGGGFPKDLPARIEADLRSLRASPGWTVDRPAGGALDHNRALLIEKPARAVAISLGYPIAVLRGHPDYPALALAASCLGQHRMSSGRLFQRMRQVRGLNYGDYAYIEYFPDGMYTLDPPVNLARRHQIFQLWIRPVDRENAHFALRLALFEMERFVRVGLTPEEFSRCRNFLAKYTRLQMKTRSNELGYRIDSGLYGIPPFQQYMDDSLQALTLNQVNDAIRRHLRACNWYIAMAGESMDAMREALLSNAPSPITYNAPKPREVLDEDRLVERLEIPLHASGIRVVPVDEMFA
jgi:zinc protease